MALKGTISKTWNTGWTYSIAWSASQSVANNTSTITCTHTLTQSSGYGLGIGTRSNTCEVDGVSKTFTSPAINQTGGTISLGTTTHTVTHNSDGTKSCKITGVFYMKATIDGSYNEKITATGTITLDTIPRKSSLSVVNGELNAPHTLTVSRKSTSFTHSIKYVCGEVTGYIKSDGTLSSTESKYSTERVKFTPPLSWANQQPSANNAVVVFTLSTYNGSTLIGTVSSAKVYFYIPDDIKPTISSLNIVDASGLEDECGKYIQGFSKASVIISVDSSNAYGATVSKYSTTIDGITYDKSSFTSNVINGTDTLTIASTITDSRGRTHSVSDTIDVHPYTRPVLSNLSVKRTDASGVSLPTGAYLTVRFDASITELPSGNNPVYTIRYGKKGEELEAPVAPNIGSDPYSVTGGYLTFNAVTSSAYDIIVTVSDPIVSSNPTTMTLLGPTTSVFFSQRTNGTGAAFGKVAEVEGGFELDWDLYSRKDLNVDGTAIFNGSIKDKFDTLIGNGLAVYTSAGIDPDTTLEPLIVTHKNTPMGTGQYMYIHTMFYATKSETANRAQIAIPYNNIGSEYHRYYANGAWSDWRRHVNADEFTDYVVEQGTKGIWTYRKWDSGIAECWGQTHHSVPTSTAWGNIFVSQELPAQTYPITFSGYPVEVASVSTRAGLSTVQTWLAQASTSARSETTSGIYRVCRPNSQSTAKYYTIVYDVKGRWK